MMISARLRVEELEPRMVPATSLLADAPAALGDASNVAVADETLESKWGGGGWGDNDDCKRGHWWKPKCPPKPCDDPCKPDCPDDDKNIAPVADDLVLSTPAETPVNGQVVATDADSDPLTYAKQSDPANGSVAFNPDGSFTYTPDTGFTGQDTFTYVASDGQALSNVATVTINVTQGEPPPVNTPPVAQDANETTPQDTPLNGQLVATDADLDPLVYADTTQPTNGTVVVNPDGTYTYTPDSGYVGPDSFTYTANDGTDDSNVATVNIDVTAVEEENTAPVASDSNEVLLEDTVFNSSVSATDGEGDPLVYDDVTQPTNGSLIMNPDGSYVYTPNLNYNGPDSFTYKANDGEFDSNIATVNLGIIPVNDEPDFTPVGDVTVAQDSGAYQGLDHTNAVTPGGGLDEASQALTYTTTNDNNALFDAQPTLTPQGTLLFTVAAGQSGEALVTASLKDDGGTALGGDDTSQDKTFKVIVTPTELLVTEVVDDPFAVV